MNTDHIEKSLAHDRLAKQFDSLMIEYDLERRLDVLIHEFLGQYDLSGKVILDAGCGTGRGTQRLVDLDANVVAMDIGFDLVKLTRQRCNCKTAVSSVMTIPFPGETFDVVFSSEVIEHTPAPLSAIHELCRVLKPGGHLVLSTPNLIWQMPVRLASHLKLRPYNGFENFLSPSQVSAALETDGGQIIRHKGIHLWPFQLRFTHKLLRRFDNYGEFLLPLMINQCVHYVKRES